MKKNAILFLIIFNVFISLGQTQEGIIGTGTDTSNVLPISTDYGYNYSQQIYLASEVLSAIGDKNRITSIKFHFRGSVSSTNFKDWKVFMGNTTKNEFLGTSQSDWISPSDLEEVFDGELIFPNPTDDWVEIVLSTPFIWDGTSNIAIAVHEYSIGDGGRGRFRKIETTTNRGLYCRSDNTNPNPLSPPSANKRVNHVAQLMLISEEITDCMPPMGTVSDITSASAKYSYTTIGSSQYIGAEYYLSTSEIAPTSTAEVIEIDDFASGELLLNNLTDSQQYYIWFRSKCSNSVYSEWSDIYTFKTLEKGQIGNGLQTGDALPISTYFGYNYSQQIYLASEVESAIGNNKNIRSIKFHIKSTGSSENFKDWKVFMGNTSKSEFEGTNQDNWIPTASINEVFNGEVIFPNPTDDWFELVLTAPFVWDGTSNIVIAVHEYTPGMRYGGEFRKKDTSTNRGIYYRDNFTNIDVLNLPNASGVVNYVPQVALFAEEIHECMYPLNISINDITTSSANFNWDMLESTQYVGMEYYLSTYEVIPTASINVNEIIDFSEGKLLLSDLDEGEQYYIWFRTKCDEGVYSQWTNVFTFMTLEYGQIGTGTSTSVILPISTDYGYNYSQQIYLESEVQLAIGDKNLISGIKFHFKGSGSTENSKGWKIFMSNTQKSEFVDENDWISPMSLQEVFDGEVVYPDLTDNWFEVVLTTPFIWDGISNIVVAIHEYSPGISGRGEWRIMETSTTRGILYRHDINEFDLSLPARASNKCEFVPQIALVGEDVPNCMYPINITLSDVASTSAKYNFNVFGNNTQGIEYYLSITDIAPTDTTIGVTINNFSREELLLENLNGDQQYFIWFRAKCGEGIYSEWSNLQSFKTLEIGQIGVGTEISDNLPISTKYDYNYSQQIYLASEVKSAIGNETLIRSIKFHFKGLNSTTNYKDWKIFMGNTSKNEFERRTQRDWVSPSTLREVYNGVLNFPDPTDDWIEIVLATPFVWDGVSNIVIAVHEYTQGSQNGGEFRKMETTKSRGLFYGSNTVNPNPLSLPNPISKHNYVPQIVLVTKNAELGVSYFDINKLIYYPNPVKDILTITYKEGIDRVEIYSLTGQRVAMLKSSSNEVVLDMSKMAPSIYFIKIYSRGVSQTIKVVKE